MVAAGDIDRRNVLLGQSHCLNLSLVVASAQSPLADTLTVYGISKVSYTFIRCRVPVRGCLAQIVLRTSCQAAAILIYVCVGAGDVVACNYLGYGVVIYAPLSELVILETGDSQVVCDPFIAPACRFVIRNQILVSIYAVMRGGQRILLTVEEPDGYALLSNTLYVFF